MIKLKNLITNNILPKFKLLSGALKEVVLLLKCACMAIAGIKVLAFLFTKSRQRSGFSSRANKTKIVIVSIFVISLMLLLSLTKGTVENNKLSYQTNQNTVIEGPFELSNTTSRYALTQAIVENKTFLLNINQAKFSAPDVVSYKGRYFSIFTPGVSFLGVPFYILGKIFGLPQLFTFLTNTLLAFLNMFLVYKIARKISDNKYASLLSGIIFTFATYALGYTYTFTQHEASTAVILLALLNSLRKRNILNNILFGILFSAGALIDIPNVIFMFPLLIYILAKNINLEKAKERTNISFNGITFGILLGLIPLISLFAIYNYQTSGSFTKLAQNIGRTENITTSPTQNIDTPSPVSDPRGRPLLRIPFQTRSMMNGFYILVFSDERSWLFFCPVLLLGIAGLYITYRRKETQNISILIISVVSLNFVLYSMFGDPWGGWSYGARYLIPGASLMAASIAPLLSQFRRNYLFLSLFMVLFAYSTFISVLGAITTNALPPKVEAINFKPPVPYTYKFNLSFIDNDKSSSLIYNAFLKDKLQLTYFLYLLAGIVFSVGLIPFAYLIKEGKEAK